MTAFLDTNILVYAQQSGAKAETAKKIVADGGVISVQVLNELANVLRRKLRRTWPEIEEAVDDVIAIVDPVPPTTADVHRTALGLARDHGLSFYDALIVAAALEAKCETLFSEDMQHGRTFGGLTIRNPFPAPPGPV